jgi:hypothetical protein
MNWKALIALSKFWGPLLMTHDKGDAWIIDPMGALLVKALVDRWRESLGEFAR